MGLFRAFRSRILYKIILPFLLLTLLVAIAGSTVAFLFIVGNAQERLNNQLAQVGRTASDSIVQQENTNLVFLRELTFAPANPEHNTPAVADAVEAGNIDGLAQALDPYFRISKERGARVDRLVIFDRTGRSLIDWDRSNNDPSNATRTSNPARDLQLLWFVPRILAGTSDGYGDKFSGLLDMGDGPRYLFTVAPIKKGEQIVGGAIIAVRVEELLRDLSARSQSAIMTVYQSDDGQAFASTVTPANGIAALNVRPALVEPVRKLQVTQEQSIFDIVPVNERNYQMAYVPLRVRNEVIGLMSVALAADYVVGPWADARLPLIGLTIMLMLAIIALGIFIARMITRPLEELVATAQAVTAGDLERRSQVRSRDEVGALSVSFNNMTAHLLDLYRTVRAEAGQRAAVFESITDGIAVCDRKGTILEINRAMRQFLNLEDDQPPPARFSDIELCPLSDTALAFDGARTPDLFQLGERVVRLSVAQVVVEDDAQLGSLYMLQDLTSEVAIDRAKTNFIGSISHELRTPLTVLGGNADLLIRGLVGPVNNEQRELLEGIRIHAVQMTALVNNVITIAGLESGTLTVELEELELNDVLDTALRPIRKLTNAKGLELTIDLPDQLPKILADEHQLKIVFQQLLDNAQRYTEAGSVTVRAYIEASTMRVDIIDTGTGIDPALQERLFTRFVRGVKDNSATERGIGLGLAIAKELIERQNGRLWLAETSQLGSTFSFVLPLANVAPHYDNLDLATAA